MTREEIKERIKTNSNKIKRCQSRINQYKQNCTSKNYQEKFYRELNSGGRNYEKTEVPDKNEPQEFGGSIREKEKNTGKMPNDLKISSSTLNIKRNKKNWKLHQKR